MSLPFKDIYVFKWVNSYDVNLCIGMNTDYIHEPFPTFEEANEFIEKVLLKLDSPSQERTGKA